MSEYDVISIVKTVLPEWKIVQILGSGSYGNVYKIRREIRTESDEMKLSESALKVINVPQDLSEADILQSNQSYLQQQKELCESIVSDFRREILVMESLRGCENIVQLEDYHIYKHSNSIGHTILIRMELLHPIWEMYPMTESEVLKLGVDICSALEICAQRNIIHRDIKPGNIFIDDAGNYKLGDFGISKIMQFADSTMTQRIGTPNYMAPEVVKSEKYDFRADMYSLGMVLYVLLNELKQPFCPIEKQILSYDDRMNAYTRRMNGEELPAPVHGSENFAKVIQRICAFRPEERYSDIKTMKQALCDLDKEKYGHKPSAKHIPLLIPKIAAALIGCSLIFLGGYLITENFGRNDGSLISETESSSEDTASADGEGIAVAEAELFEYSYNEDENSYTLTKLLDESVIDAVIPESYNGLPVTAIGAGAFEYSMIESVIIPNSVTRIEKNAFFRCEHLRSVYIPASVVEMQLDRVDKRYTSPFVLCVNLSSIEVAPENPVYHSSGNCIIETAAKRLVQGCYTSVIPEDGSVKIIGSGAFSGIEGLEVLAIPERVEAIEAGAFWDAGIRDLTIPASVLEIDAYAFNYCCVLDNISVHRRNPVYVSENDCIIRRDNGELIVGCIDSVIPSGVKIIGEHAFYGRDLEEIIIPDNVEEIHDGAFTQTKLKHVVIPEGITKIDKYTFYKCTELESIYLPRSVEIVKLNAFQDCENLKTVYYGGSTQEWWNIDRETGNDALQNAVIMYNYSKDHTQEE